MISSPVRTRGKKSAHRCREPIQKSGIWKTRIWTPDLCFPQKLLQILCRALHMSISVDTVFEYWCSNRRCLAICPSSHPLTSDPVLQTIAQLQHRASHFYHYDRLSVPDTCAFSTEQQPASFILSIHNNHPTYPSIKCPHHGLRHSQTGSHRHPRC